MNPDADRRSAAAADQDRIPPDAFANAVRGRDIGAARGLFAEDAELHSPVTAEPIVGGPYIEQLFVLLQDIFQDLEITTELGDADRYVFGFDARVGDEAIQILDVLTFDDRGRIKTLVVHSRPLSGTNALAEAIAPNRDLLRP